jgi:hypothetical protein
MTDVFLDLYGYFLPLTFCVSALPATDFTLLLDDLLFNSFEAVRATRLLVVSLRLVGIVFSFMSPIFQIDVFVLSI